MLFIQICVRYLSNSETLKHMSKLKGPLKLLKIYFWFVSVFFNFPEKFFLVAILFFKTSNCFYTCISMCIPQMSVDNKSKLSKYFL